MLCQNCKKNEATTHIKRVINGEATESHFCHTCAQNSGVGSFFDDFSLNLPGLFSSFFGENSFALNERQRERCESCGCSFDDIVKTGKVGCSDCYKKFYQKLSPSLQRIHGKTKHQGKVPRIIPSPVTAAEKTTEEKIEDLQNEMNKAIDEQNFEKAAILRDEIKALKGDK